MIKNMTTLGKVFDWVDDMSKEHRDELVSVKSVSFDSLETIRIAGRPHRIKPVAQRSFCNRLGIPHQYLKKCPVEIQSANMNYWIGKERNEELFFRFDGTAIRALFTPRYTPVDNFEVLARLDDMGYGPDTEVQCHLDEEFMSLSIPDGQRTFTVNGDRFTPGITISNSEVGLSAVSVAAFVLRLVCTNGMISQTQFSASYRHVSSKVLELFPQTLQKVAYELGKKKDQFQISMNTPVDDPLKTIETFNRQFQLPKSEATAVIEYGWPQESGATMFNIVNAYTRASQHPDLSAVSSFNLQKVGGSILGMLK